jgi:hypothetical protein
MYDLELLKLHLEAQWGKSSGQQLRISDPHNKMPSEFRVVKFPPSEVHDFWVYSTLGMSIDMTENLLELHIFSAKQADDAPVELLTIIASFHRNDTHLNLHHSITIGRPWQDNSLCDHAFISLPYLDGDGLELFSFGKNHLHNLWLLPITEQERDFKMLYGPDALEEKFEECKLNYLDANRKSCV